MLSTQCEYVAIPPSLKGTRTSNFLGKMDGDIPIKRSRFTEAQIMGVLRQTESGLLVAARFREHGIGSAKIYK